MKLPDDYKPVQPPGQRPCMDDYEYDTWEFWNSRTMKKDTAQSPCEDCTVDFSQEMAKIGLCDGVPTVVLSPKGKVSTDSPVKAARVHAHKATWTPERRQRKEHK
jgi:hypothetical protein